MLFYHLLFWGITIGILFPSRWIAGSWKWGYLAGGLAFGFYNEFLYEFCWEYSSALGPFLWRDVAAVVILGWGAIGMLSMTLSDRFAPRLKALPLGVATLVLDVAIYCLFGVSQEITMSSSGFWKYNFPIQGWFPFQFLGYIGVALLISSLGRRLEALRTPR